ncbi:MAG: C10 family peptidase [Muribaculaceae bacterium]|nr:C10 family peptidase [Muribaculaceae bacterium]
MIPLFAALVFAGTVSAAPLSPREALARLESSSVPRKAAPLTRESPVLAATKGNIYIFNTPGGFLVLPADDRAPALLGYSDEGQYDPKGNPAFDYWLSCYNKELVAPEAEGATVRNDARNAPVRRAERKAIDPLTKTRWNQEAPYNELCPRVNGHETVTGCVATAMAQVMKYHSWPAVGKGSHSYYWNVGKDTLKFDYSATQFQWDLMTDTYDDKSTAEERTAVATLMLACGVSVDMHYDIGDSGAATIKMGVSLIDYFDYDRAMWMPSRPYYGMYEWEDMIYADLAQGLPVLYAGQGTGGGHQFICDGYSSDGFFHFNWGWGGMANGYFLLDALNPADLGVGGGAGGFNADQTITLGVRPASSESKPTYLIYCTGDFKPGVMTVKAGEDLKCSGGYFNYGLTRLANDTHIGMKIESEDRTTVKFIRGYNLSGFGPLDGVYDDTVRFPELPDGTYTITPVFYDGSKWQPIRCPIGAQGSITAVVKDNIATLSLPAQAEVNVTEIDVPAKIFIGRDFPVKFTVENPGKEEYYGKLTPCLIKADSEERVAVSSWRLADVEPEHSERITDYIGNFKADEGIDLTPGEYRFVMRDNAGKDVSEPITVTLAEAPEGLKIKVSYLRIEDQDPVTDKEDVKFIYTLKVDEGYFTDVLQLWIFNHDGHSVYSHDTPMLYLEAPTTHYGALNLDLSPLEAGEYIAVMYHAGHGVSDEYRFRIDDVETLVETIPAADAQSASLPRTYDLLGRPMAHPALPGLYIRDGKKVILK